MEIRVARYAGRPYLYRTVEVFRCAVTAIIDFASSQYKSIFSPAEAADIKQVMHLYAGEDTEQQKAVGKWLVGYAESRELPAPVELKTLIERSTISRKCRAIGESATDKKE